MNFGKHGRTILMSALLAATSTVVFAGTVPGVASAAAGTIKVGGFPADNSGNANDPHIGTSCVGIRTFDMDTSKPLVATFTLQSPTKGTVAPLVVSATVDAGVMAVDVANWLAKVPASKQGYHLNVNVDGKQKTFWVDDLSTGCPKPAPKCTAPTDVLGAVEPPATTTIYAGDFVGMDVLGSHTAADLNPQFTVDTTAVGAGQVFTNADGTVAAVAYQLPASFAAGTHTITLQVGDPATTCPTTWTFTSAVRGSVG
jgi:hypothetical protein